MDSKTPFQNLLIAASSKASNDYNTNAYESLNTYLTAQAPVESTMFNLTGTSDTNEHNPLNAVALTNNYNSYCSQLKTINGQATSAGLLAKNVVALSTTTGKAASTAKQAVVTAAKAINTANQSIVLLLQNIASISIVLTTDNQDEPSALISNASGAVRAAASKIESASQTVIELNGDVSKVVSTIAGVSTDSNSSSTDIDSFIKALGATLKTIKASADKADQNYLDTIQTLYKNQQALDQAEIDLRYAGYPDDFKINENETNPPLPGNQNIGQEPDYIKQLNQVINQNQKVALPA